MAGKIVVTNLRIPEDEWLTGKILASEYGISTNELIRRLLREVAVKRFMAPDVRPTKGKKSKMSIWDALMKLSKVKGGKPLGPLSEEDRIIYEVAQ